MFRAILLTSIFAATSIFASSQTGSISRIKGIVVNQSSGAPVPFASIQVRNTGIGTMASADGQFQLQLDSSYLGDGLVVSSLGFHTRTFDMLALSRETENRFILTETTIQLNEVTVTPFQAREIMKKAIDKLKLNFEVPPHQLKAFYRNTFQNDGNFTRLLEAAVTINDRHGNVFGSRNIDIQEIRKAKDFRTDPWRTYNGYLNHLVFNQPLQSTWWDFMKKSKLTQFDVELEGTKLQDTSSYYILNVKPKRATREIPYEAQVIIRESNSAIVDITIRWKPELSDYFSWSWEKRPDQKFIADWQQSHYTYQELNGHYYLKSAQWHCVGKVIQISDSKKLYDTESFDELLIFAIEPPPSRNATADKGKVENAKTTASNMDIYEVADHFPYHENFWRTFNRPVDSQRFIKAKREMEREETLEAQFRKYTGTKVGIAATSPK